jgi:predicted MPP superfamily phosphohydrolase
MRAGFLAILALVFALTGYVSWHLWRIAPPGWKLAVTGLFLLWMASMFAGFAYTERVPVKLATVLYEVGNTWMIAFLYLLLVFIVADIASLCHLLPKTLIKDSTAGLLGAIGIVALIMTLGAIHYPHKFREELTLTTDKTLEKPLTIVLASDLHIGYHNRRAELARWVNLINAEKPDLVLIGGDIIDRSLRPVTEGHYEEEFRRLEAPVWTVLGNHESYAGLAQAEQFFEAAGIRVLKDSVAHFKGVDVIGRKDRSARNRAALQDLADGLEGFKLLLDHQPNHLEEAEQAGIDFQFSGHTHRGQVWPVSWATDLMFEKSWGHYRKGDTRYYISSGLGLWGAKIRVGTRSEYLVLKLNGKDD